MRTLDRYLIKEILASSGVIFAIMFAAFLLERSLRIIQTLGASEQLLTLSLNLLLNFVPQLFGMVLTVAVFGGILLTFSKLKQKKELDVIFASGVGLHQLIRPVVVLAILVTFVSVGVFGFLKPIGSYQERALRHQAKQESLKAFIEVGTFIHDDGKTFLIKDASRKQNDLGKIFVVETDQNGSEVVTTAEKGTLSLAENEKDLFLVARSGETVEIESDGASRGILAFQDARWLMASTNNKSFRTRGGHEAELLLPELWAANRNGLASLDEMRINSELHSRLAHIFLIPLLPFTAAPLALGRGRLGQVVGIGLGIIVVALLEESLLLGEALASQGLVSPLIGIWGPVICLAALGSILFPLAVFKVNDDPFQKGFDAIARLKKAMSG